jgi:hypothetical protein
MASSEQLDRETLRALAQKAKARLDSGYDISPDSIPSWYREKRLKELQIEAAISKLLND